MRDTFFLFFLTPPNHFNPSTVTARSDYKFDTALNNTYSTCMVQLEAALSHAFTQHLVYVVRPFKPLELMLGAIHLSTA